MSQTKYPMLNKRIKRECIDAVRAYGATAEYYHARRWEIMQATPPPSEPVTGGGGDSRDSENRAIELDRLDREARVATMHAVDAASRKIGADLPVEFRPLLVDAVKRQYINQRTQHYKSACKRLDIGPDAYYERCRKFLWHIALALGYRETEIRAEEP